MEELAKKLWEVPQFVALGSSALHQAPFKPKLEKHEIEQQPFTLQMTTRLMMRKAYDQNYKKKCEEKEKRVSRSFCLTIKPIYFVNLYF